MAKKNARVGCGDLTGGGWQEFWMESLESRLLLTVTLSGVSSTLGNMRFLTGSQLSEVDNTYTADIQGSPSKVVFALGTSIVTDTTASDGWAAAFNMSAVSTSQHTLTITAFEGTSSTLLYSHSISVTALPLADAGHQIYRRLSIARNGTFRSRSTSLL